MYVVSPPVSQDHAPLSHTIVEAHPEVYARMLEEGEQFDGHFNGHFNGHQEWRMGSPAAIDVICS